MESPVQQLSASLSSVSPRLGQAPTSDIALRLPAAKANPAQKAPLVEIDPAKLSEQIQEAVARLNDQMISMQRDLGFSYDDRINREIVTVKKQSTGEVVRQLPPEVAIRVAHSIEDLKGVLYDEIF